PQFADPVPPAVLKSTYFTYDSFIKLKSKPPLLAKDISYPERSLAKASADLGFVNIEVDRDQKTRKEPLIINYGDNYYPALVIQVAKRFLQVASSDVKIDPGNAIQLKNVDIPIDNKGRMLINYNGLAGLFPTYSAVDILKQKIDPTQFKNKVVLIGLSASGLAPQVNTPFAFGLPGVEKTAQVVENIIHKNFLNAANSFSLGLLLIILIGGFSAFMLPRVSLMYRFIILGVFMFVLINLNFILFSAFKVISKTFFPFLELLFFLAASPAIKTKEEQKRAEKRRAYREFEEYEEEEYDVPSYMKEDRFVEPDSKSATKTITVKVEDSYETMDIPTLEEEKKKSKTPTPTLAGAVPTFTEFGRYKVVETIGKGAMGMVYKGMDPAIDRPVALKTIRLDFVVDPSEVEELKERLVREAKAAGKLSHPNIVTIYDVGQQGEFQYIAMEYLKGHTLEKLIKKGMEWNYKILANIIIQICDALDYAHSKGIVHRDIKPANIMVLDDFKIKVMDFGIARFDATNMTQTGVAMGTPNYISPEQLQGKPASARSDIFSVGVVLYELLSGEKPFKGETITALIYNILNTHPPGPSTVNPKIPPFFDRVLERATAKNSDERYQTAREMSFALRDFVATFIPLKKPQVQAPTQE
ncbi:MAG: CHASE2 domain-containing serine/threonine-protein kinase, partial [Thermodesulfobacteriota bacterium]